ncbi:superoxide dismutase family protein [Bacillus sp. 2205SS5-2]|uniref:superoxide dismutase family protein n=1 Tax=Bacillus sp. 2205SS5-2 TaxID=3109031 RepID=UPI003FA5D435
MKNKRTYCLLMTCLLLSACVYPDVRKIDVDMKNADGDSIGTITLQEQAEGVMVNVDVEGLTPGDHGIHFHEKGSCEAPDFTSAGGHFNPDNHAHGLMNQDGAHAGDLPNLTVKDDGSAKAEILATQVTLDDGKSSLFTKEGTAIVIHEVQDDGTSQPAGDAGIRVACGEIQKDEKAEKKE